VNQVAFANPDGSFALVAHDTTGSGGSLDVTSGAATMRVTLPAGGAVTLVWR
jgi:glucosylceramidase